MLYSFSRHQGALKGMEWQVQFNAAGRGRAEPEIGGLVRQRGWSSEPAFCPGVPVPA